MPNDKSSKPAERGTINLHLTSFENPLKNLSDEDRLKIIAELAKQHGEEYEANYHKLQELIRSANPFDVLAHFAFYDLLFLDQSPEEMSRNTNVFGQLTLNCYRHSILLCLTTSFPPNQHRLEFIRK